jgi:hypothetical protein
MMILLTLVTAIAFAQVEPPRIGDRGFEFEIEKPAHARGEGPVVLIDEAHNNFHTAAGTYKPFASFLEQDGCVIRRGRSKITEKELGSCKVLVISDAMPLEDGKSPISEQEVKAIYNWVKEGGSLFLITDHFPDPPAVETLAAVFGVTLNNGYVLNTYPEKEEQPIEFKKSDGSLKPHKVTERIESVATFTGCAFKVHGRFVPLMVLGPGKRSWTPEKPYEFDENTKKVDVAGWCQGAVADFGKGKVAVFGEAAMFTAQLFGPEKKRVGMNHPAAKNNARFLLNLIHWLTG